MPLLNLTSCYYLEMRHWTSVIIWKLCLLSLLPVGRSDKDAPKECRFEKGLGQKEFVEFVHLSPLHLHVPCFSSRLMYRWELSGFILLHLYMSSMARAFNVSIHRPPGTLPGLESLGIVIRPPPFFFPLVCKQSGGWCFLFFFFFFYLWNCSTKKLLKVNKT